MFSFLARRDPIDLVGRDADRLVQEAGEHAFLLAGEMSWREDAGLMSARRPGHWRRVQFEIAKRHGVPRGDSAREPFGAVC